MIPSKDALHKNDQLDKLLELQKLTLETARQNRFAAQLRIMDSSTKKADRHDEVESNPSFSETAWDLKLANLTFSKTTGVASTASGSGSLHPATLDEVWDHSSTASGKTTGNSSSSPHHQPEAAASGSNSVDDSYGSFGSAFFDGMKRFLNKNYQVFAGHSLSADQPINLQNVEKLKLPEAMGWDRFASRFGIQEPCPNTAPLVFDLKSTVMIENRTQEYCLQLQVSARIKLGFVDAIDTHENTSTDAPYFMLPRTTSTPISSPFRDGSQLCRDSQNQITQSAKPDCIAASAVCCLEVKPGTKCMELILQLFERCASSMTTCHLLKFCVAFGYCVGKAFICIGERDVKSDPNPYQIKMTLFSLADAELIDLYWHALSTLPITRFLSRDAIPIWRALNALDVNPFFCRIELLGRSINRVYGVYFPFSGPRGAPTFITKPRPDPWKVIKVVDGDANYESEKAALEAVRPAWYSGHFSQIGQRLPPKPDQSVKQIAPTQSVWWNKLPDDGFSGGLILMEPGKQICSAALPNNQLNWEQVLLDCFHSLQRIHERGYCHCDVRVPNICKFGDKYEVIDYGFARKLSISGGRQAVKILVRVHRPYLPEQMQLAIAKVETLDPAIVVPDEPIYLFGFTFFVDFEGRVWIEWNPRLDFEMLEHNVRTFRLRDGDALNFSDQLRGLPKQNAKQGSFE